ncbi:MAG: histidine phosphatase family protein, partial [Rubrivivax sp.]|nr:histidine phosphatase family protein [Rubrivivax sp.]
MNPLSQLRPLAVIVLAACAFITTAAQAQLTIYVARHGQTDWNREGRIQGGTDNALNATGREQAATLGRTLVDVRVDTVYTSSHQRARQTAAVFEGRAPVVALDELRERFFG